MNAQEKYFERLKQVLSPAINLADEVAGALGMSEDSAYRRIRGETDLNIEELRKLVKHFKVLPEFLEDEEAEAISLRYKPLGNTAESLREYLQYLLGNLQQIPKFNDPHIYFAAKDIPVFYHFQLPVLSAFKLFFWMKSVLSFPELEAKRFEAGVVDEEFLKLTKQIIQTYIKIPSTEIWTEETINSSLKQIEYYWEAGIFKSKEDVLPVLNELGQLIEQIETQAATGKKYFSGEKAVVPENNFTLYFSDMVLSNNSIIVSTENFKTVYLTHNTFNSMSSSNEAFCKETNFWMKNLIKRSTLISGVAEKQRYQYFSQVREKIEALEGKVGI